MLKRLIIGVALLGGLYSTAPAWSDTSSQYPPLSGTYTSSPQHPRVFMTPADLQDFVSRINMPGSFSAQTFVKLANQVKADLAAKVDWDAVYSGCDLDIYLHAFSIEATNGYAQENRSADQLSKAMNVKPGMLPAHGAAIVASRLALYAALVKEGAKTSPGFPDSGQAAALSKRILLAWANHGFRDQSGNYLHAAEQICDDKDQFKVINQSGTGLQVARGVKYSVHAQDLLQTIGQLNEAEVTQLNAFHSAMFDLIQEATNFTFALPYLKVHYRMCERYSNHIGAHLEGLLAISRLLDDSRKFNAVLFGTDSAIPVPIPWTVYFNHAIYGENDKPIACYPNTGHDRSTSINSFQTPVVAPGEIEDRYRNSTPLQGFGYPLGLLAGFYNMADMIQNAGFDAYGYRGAHHQSIEMATQYYACYGKSPGFYKTVTGDNATSCPDYQEYVDQLVNGLEMDIVMGSYHFPSNKAITELEAAAKAKAGRNLLDPLRFGRWRD